MSRSAILFDQARKIIPGGVNSPVRAFGSVGGTPRFIARAAGQHVFDADGQRYIDYVGSWGPMLLGHAHPEVIAAVREAAGHGLSFGAPTEVETEMARAIQSLFPSMEQLRMVSSGTEATMSAIRLARGFTGRDNIVKFEGCYHGHADALLVQAGSGALTFGVPSSAGVPAAFARHTLTAAFNDNQAIEQLFNERGDSIACVIVEPIAGNMNFVPPKDGFLEKLRELCSAHGAVLIFDEVMTGFRVAAGGAQARFGITPDLTTLGKVIGGGMPVGAFGGRSEIMAELAPLGPVYQAGTLSGNPIAMHAGLKTLELLKADGFYDALEARTTELVRGLIQNAKKHDIGLCGNLAGGMFGFFFTDVGCPRDLAGVTATDTERFRQFFHKMLDAGHYLAPSPYEAGFVSAMHTEADIAATLAAADAAFAAIAKAA